MKPVLIAAWVGWLWIGLICAGSLEAQTGTTLSGTNWVEDSLGGTNAAGARGFRVESFSGLVYHTDGKTRNRTDVRKLPEPLARNDDLGTRANSRAIVLGINKVSAMDQNTQIRVLDLETIEVVEGRLYFKSIENLENPTAKPAIFVKMPNGQKIMPVGTEFVLEVHPETGASDILSMDGKVVAFAGTNAPLTNAAGQRVLLSNEALPAQENFKLESIYLNNIIQWVLYYPATIDPRELPWEAVVGPEWAGAWQWKKREAGRFASPVGR